MLVYQRVSNQGKPSKFLPAFARFPGHPRQVESDAPGLGPLELRHQTRWLENPPFLVDFPIAFAGAQLTYWIFWMASLHSDWIILDHSLIEIGSLSGWYFETWPTEPFATSGYPLHVSQFFAWMAYLIYIWYNTYIYIWYSIYIYLSVISLI